MNIIFNALILLLLQSSKPAGIPEIPEASGVYYLQNNVHWIRLQPASIDKMKTKGLELFVETGGYTNLGMNIIYPGAKAALRLTVAKPIFFVREAGSSKDAILIRLAQKNNARTFYASSIDSSAENKGGFKKGDIRKLAATEYPDHTYSLAPEEKLSSGEYLLVFGSATSGFDFGIDKTK
jgi:hypothetical protein